MKFLKSFFLLVFAAFCICGCAELTSSFSADFEHEAVQREWTTVVYMAADNDLEAHAISDMKELESVDMRGKKCDVLVLIDRAKGGDATNGDWDDTRLFKVAYSRGSHSADFTSTRIDCPELGISTDSTIELDMGNENTLRSLLSFAKRRYPARHYALIIWGHGSGWRGASVDAETDSYMTTVELARAVSDFPLDVIAYDTCFGGVIENAYELSGKAKWLVASEGVTPSSGWDYGKVFSSFLAETAKTPEAFCKSIVAQYGLKYKNEPLASISQIDLDKIPRAVDALSSFSFAVADGITTATVRDDMRSMIFKDTRSFSYPDYPCDMYVDIYDFAEKFLNGKNGGANIGNDVMQKASTLQSDLRDCVVQSWSADGDANPRLGVHFIPLTSKNTTDGSHNPAYYNGINKTDLLRFVRDCTGWVPSDGKVNNSLIDRLYYISF